MARSTRERIVTIGTGKFTARCPVPREGIGFWEAFALSLRGWSDARRTKGVADTAHTHSLHRLLAVHRRRETEADRRIDEALSAVDLALAPLAAVIDRRIPDAPQVPGTEQLEALPSAQRVEWAAHVRAAQTETRRLAGARARRVEAEAEAAVLRSIRRSVSVEGEDVRRQWAEAYTMRAARYTRARFGRRGRPVDVEPAVAAYRHTDGPTADRSIDEGTA